MIAVDLADIIVDEDGPACVCSLALKGAEEPLSIRMICRASYGSNLDPRGKLLAWLDDASMPRGSDWGYGLALAKDLPSDMSQSVPSDMSQSVQGDITDAAGNVWRIEAARPILDVNCTTIAAWRFALSGLRRVVRR